MQRSKNAQARPIIVTIIDECIKHNNHVLNNLFNLKHLDLPFSICYIKL